MPVYSVIRTCLCALVYLTISIILSSELKYLNKIVVIIAVHSVGCHVECLLCTFFGLRASSGSTRSQVAIASFPGCNSLVPRRPSPWTRVE